MTFETQTRKSLFYKHIILLSLVITLVLSILFLNTNQQQAKISVDKHRASQQMPNLIGEKAEEYLQEQGLYKSLGEAMKAARYSINPINNAPFPVYKKAFEANNPGQAFSTYFAKDGIHLVSRAKNNKWRVQMNLEGYGYGENIINVEQQSAEVQKNKSRIEIEKSEVRSPKSKVENKSAIRNPKSRITEWYENSPNGLEQGWTIDEKPLSANAGELNLVIKLGGDLKAKLAEDKQAIHFVRGNDEQVLRYDKLQSWDADGKELPSCMELDGKTLSIVVDEKDAKYPITVDPFFTQTKKLTASDAGNGDNFGSAVAISGNTAVVGASGSDAIILDSGAVYIFERNSDGAGGVSANFWGEVKRITASDAGLSDNFGEAVSIDNDTVVVGASSEDGPGNSGAAYVFERNTGGADNWGEVKKLKPATLDASDFFGRSVAISNHRIVVGAINDDDITTDSGAAYIFERNSNGAGGTLANNWGVIRKLKASDATNGSLDRFGNSVSISDDTVVVGASLEDSPSTSGAVYIFDRNMGGADSWGELKKLTASDADVDDRFGNSVSISDDTLIVAASQDDVNEVNSGSVYIYERNHGGGGNWGEVKKLNASDGAATANFGWSVSISGSVVIVGAFGHDGIPNNSGAAYIFERNKGGADFWGEVQKLTASDAAAQDNFGISVAISGNTAIVGANGNDDVPDDSGSAYIYTNIFSNWQEILFQEADDGSASDLLGIELAISGDTVVASASGDDVGGNEDQGSAYIFQRNQGGVENWGQVKKLVSSDGASFDRFGRSVGISGDTVIVGAFFHDVGGNSAQGAAYIFGRNQGGGDNWGQVRILSSSDGSANDWFGRGIAISGDTAVVGSVRSDIAPGSDQGAAYIFKRNQGGRDLWGEVKKLTAPNGEPEDFFGDNISISNDTIVVGSYFDDVGANVKQGSAYIFARNKGGTDNWGLVKQLLSSDGTAESWFGNSVSISGDTIIAGSERHEVNGNDIQGSAYIFERNNGGADNWGEVKRLVAFDGVVNGSFGFYVDISGDIAVVGVFGGGGAYIYERNKDGADSWGLVKKVFGSDVIPTNTGGFGRAVGISVDTVVVGAPSKERSAPLSSNQTLSSKSANLGEAAVGGIYIYKAIAAPTSASASISGKVLSPKGRGISQAIVHLTDESGNTQSARANHFGYFRFNEIEVGQTLILNAYHKRYQFNTQVIDFDDSITGLQIIAQ